MPFQFGLPSFKLVEHFTATTIISLGIRVFLLGAFFLVTRVLRWLRVGEILVILSFFCTIYVVVIAMETNTVLVTTTEVTSLHAILKYSLMFLNSS